MIANPQQLAKMFATLGLRVATEEEYIALWRKELLSEREALEKVGVMEIEIHGEMIWCFDEAKGMKQWPKI